MKIKWITLTLITFTMFNLFGQEKSKVDKEFKSISSKIFPVIKVATSENHKEADFEFIGDDQPVFKTIAGDLLCFYGIDKGSHFELLQKRQMPENIGIEELDQFAHDNLIKFVADKTQIHNTSFGGIGFSCGGDHEASLMTLPEIWSMINEKLGESIVFAVPAKDLIVFVESSNEQSVEGLKSMIEEIHKDGERLLSKKLFTYENGIIEEKK
ncbi:DUF1444 family protein [Psychroserpens sp. BH13MA-6]